MASSLHGYLAVFASCLAFGSLTALIKGKAARAGPLALAGWLAGGRRPACPTPSWQVASGEWLVQRELGAPPPMCE